MALTISMDIILPILITTEKVMMIRKHCQKGVTGGSIDKGVHRAAWSHQKKKRFAIIHIYFFNFNIVILDTTCVVLQ